MDDVDCKNTDFKRIRRKNENEESLKKKECLSCRQTLLVDCASGWA